MENGNTAVSKRLRQAREEAQLSYADLSARTGFSKSVLQRYEMGTVKKLPLDRLEIIARALGVSHEWLLTGNESRGSLTPQDVTEQIRLKFIEHGILQEGDDLTDDQLTYYLDKLRQILQNG
ncbi:MAG: helix-turn-helix transcriptional regulator [Clostridia bacterium]|nr:helix-turn-helix transcriptional regulator [Clostridia bacterium]